MRRVIFVNRYFHPDHSATSQMLSDLAFHLADRGWQVQVITSRQRYDEPAARLPSRERVENVEIIRVATTRFGRSFLPGRVVDYLTFYLTAFFALLRRSSRNTVVVALTDPPLISVVAATAAMLRGARLVNWLHDLFPEVAEQLFERRSRLPLRALRNWSLRRARVNVVLGERMAALVPWRVVVQHNWADSDLRPLAPAENRLRREWQIEDAFVVAYSGNLGRAHEFATITGAIDQLRDEPSIRFVIVGAGAQLAAVERQTNGASNVQFRPYQPREALRESLSVGDAHLISLQPQLEGLVQPSKFYGILAVGRPAIFIGARDGELARLIDEHELGFVIEPGDRDSLARALRKLAGDRAAATAMGRRGRALYESRFAPELAFSGWEKILGEASHG